MAPPLLFAIIIHEVAHGWMALRFGDPTARDAGRLTLNPLPHIDLFGTIIVPLLLFLSNTGFLFGWAKPVPVNPYNLRNPREQLMWVSAAGPGSTPEDWLRFAIHFFGYIADIIPADGSYPESRVYGAPYAAEGASPFLRTLKRVKGVDLFARTPFFRNFAYGRMYAVWDHPRHVGISNFGEGSPDSEWHCMGWIWAFAAAYRDPVLQWSANAWHRARPMASEQG